MAAEASIHRTGPLRHGTSSTTRAAGQEEGYSRRPTLSYLYPPHLISPCAHDVGLHLGVALAADQRLAYPTLDCSLFYRTTI